MNNNYYLVTTQVTYRIDQAKSHDEALSIVEHHLANYRHIDGFYLEGIRDGFWDEISEDENGISSVDAGNFGEQTEREMF